MILLKSDLSVKVFSSGGVYISNPPARYGYDIFWMTKAQSNTIGRAPIRAGIDDDYSAVIGKVFQFGYNSQAVSAATNPLDQVNENAGQMGLWLEFCKAIVPTLAGNRKILLVPCAQGGTSFNGGHWNAGNSLDNSSKARLAAAMALPGGTNRLCGVLTLLGESDADAGATASGLFEGRYQAAYNDYLANVPGISSATPWIMGTIKPDKANATTINAALANLDAANAGMHLVTCTDLAWLDSDHYDAASLATIGQRFAQKYLEVAP
ncbi:hypothetical protein D0C16_05465 [Cellvibrio sp. KY-GH-1]|uniref:sialate O-acetylesterase n=1 Tax=Cellvibrio sp. KY-GH-1 TaxID=2303332 RepID=UPI001247ABBF|nr:sialate O-acetylesterase [Cellvibrio sp. KY-GH-1]QEY15469.1 hypothetical protein D0C16_05465 [Cellvibrio sp. KY-GH-1]